MISRRKFIAQSVGVISMGTSLLKSLCWPNFSQSEKSRKPVASRTKLESLVNENPADLDSSQLEITPLEKFGVMGLQEFEVDILRWRLKIEGKVGNPLELSYPELKDLPSIEKPVLLICRGIFAYNGLWMGVAISELLNRSNVVGQAQYVSFAGPPGNYEKVEKFKLDEAKDRGLLLAYKVNGQDLPVKHGFPLRLVAPGFFGDQWVKYVYKITLS